MHRQASIPSASPCRAGRGPRLADWRSGQPVPRNSGQSLQQRVLPASLGHIVGILARFQNFHQYLCVTVIDSNSPGMPRLHPEDDFMEKCRLCCHHCTAGHPCCPPLLQSPYSETHDFDIGPVNDPTMAPSARVGGTVSPFKSKAGSDGA